MRNVFFIYRKSMSFEFGTSQQTDFQQPINSRHFQQPWLVRCPWPLFLSSQQAFRYLGQASIRILEGSISSAFAKESLQELRLPELDCGLLKKSPLSPKPAQGPSFRFEKLRGKSRGVSAWELQREHKFLCNFLLVWCCYYKCVWGGNDSLKHPSLKPTDNLKFLLLLDLDFL